MSGKVFLVGAGPGDPGLITVKGLEALRSADTVVYDALASPELLSYCEDAELIDVGKRGGDHKRTQSEINSLLVELGRSGKVVVRLKGGDPFLFGRGAEEVRELRRAGIEVHVVPGVTSPVAVPELAGIPITHRDHSSSVTFVTGHSRADIPRDINWRALAETGGTIVILMGMENSEKIAEALMEGGLDHGTKAAVIVNGSTPDQITKKTTVGRLSADIKQDGLKAPGIIVIGKVVEEQEDLGDLR